MNKRNVRGRGCVWSQISAGRERGPRTPARPHSSLGQSEMNRFSSLRSPAALYPFVCSDITTVDRKITVHDKICRNIYRDTLDRKKKGGTGQSPSEPGRR